MSNFEKCLKPLLQDEGGNDDDPHDPGGRTSRGIIQSEYNRYRDRHNQPRRDVWTASDEEVADIYRREYWDALHCDDLPAGVDYAVFDYGVNSGIGRGAKVLQKVIGAHVDGQIGPETIRMVTAMPAAKIINDMMAERLNFLQHLGTWSHFGRGWSRRINHVRNVALKMAEAEHGPGGSTEGK